MEHLIRTWWSKYGTGIFNQQYKDSNKKSNSSQENQEEHTNKQMDNQSSVGFSKSVRSQLMTVD